MVEDLEDPRRTEPPFLLGDEREMLEAWLEFHRTTLLLKCEGLDDAGRKSRPVLTSKLSLHGWCATWRRLSGIGSVACSLKSLRHRPSDTTPRWRTASLSLWTTPTGKRILRRGRPSAMPVAGQLDLTHSMTRGYGAESRALCDGSSCT